MLGSLLTSPSVTGGGLGGGLSTSSSASASSQSDVNVTSETGAMNYNKAPDLSFLIYPVAFVLGWKLYGYLKRKEAK